MSPETETHELDTERAERPVLRRAYETEITPGDGRTIDVRIIRYNQEAVVGDPPWAPTRVYRESWDPGCFDDQTRAANRVDVLMNFEHEEGIGGLIGRGVALRSEPDAFYGSFRVFDGHDGDKALQLVNEGVLRGISLEAYPKKTIRTADGLIRRVKAHLDKVALCRKGAFEGAEVLAVREEVILDEELLPLDLSPDIIQRCQRLGVRLPERYKAHPAATGTPPDGGTPEDGTRLTDQAHESSEVKEDAHSN